MCFFWISRVACLVSGWKHRLQTEPGTHHCGCQPALAEARKKQLHLLPESVIRKQVLISCTFKPWPQHPSHTHISELTQSPEKKNKNKNLHHKPSKRANVLQKEAKELVTYPRMLKINWWSPKIVTSTSSFKRLWKQELKPFPRYQLVPLLLQDLLCNSSLKRKI